MYAISIPAGRLTIRPSAKDSMSCEVWLDDQLIGNFGSAGLAARVIGEKRSGCSLIDAADVHVPDSIEAWNWISVNESVLRSA